MISSCQDLRDQEERRPGVAMVPLLVGILTGSLAVSMVNTALPSIVADLGARPTHRAWIVDVYPLAMAASIVVAARLGDRFGRKALLLTGMTGFAVMNAVAGVAHGPGVLIGARVLLGVAGALVVANVVSTIAALYRGHARTVANGLWVATFGAANAVGPILGGALTDHFGWRSVFLACVPIAVSGIALTIWLVPDTRSQAVVSWDVPSVLGSAVALGGIVFGVQHVVANPVVGVTIAVVAIAVFAAFVRRQRRLSAPFIAVELFCERGFAGSFAQVLVSSATAAASVYLISIHVQDALGWSPTQAGLVLIPQAAATAVGGICGPLLVRVMSRPVVVALALTLQSAGLWWIAQGGGYAPGLALVGFGFGIVGTLAVVALFNATPTALLSHAGALQEIAFAVGSGLGIAVFDVIAGFAGTGGFARALTIAGVATLAVAALPTRTRR
ncbi:MFS transporter [Mycobacterium sp. DSM 3803]|nr:MFS transporter [Mycobacterium sp. DSM 3803]